MFACLPSGLQAVLTAEPLQHNLALLMANALPDGPCCKQQQRKHAEQMHVMHQLNLVV